MRAAGLDVLVSTDLGDASIRIVDASRDAETGILALDDTIRAADVLADAMTRALHANPDSRPLVVGGDCSILLGILPAVCQAIGPRGCGSWTGTPITRTARRPARARRPTWDLALVTGDGPASLVGLASNVPMVHPGEAGRPAAATRGVPSANVAGVQASEPLARPYPAGVGRMHRRDRFLVRVPPEHAFALAGDPSRFPEFNPLVRVPPGSRRVEHVGNVYHQVLTLGPIRVSTRWETTRVEPEDLARQPRPEPPWTTVEVGLLPLFGTWISTSRYEAVTAGTLITHDLEYGVPDGLPGRVVDVTLMWPLLSVGMGLLGRRLRRWIEAG